MITRLVSLLQEEAARVPFGSHLIITADGDWVIVTARVLGRSVEVTRLGLVEDEAFALVGYHPLLAPLYKGACERAKIRFNRGGK